MCACSCCFVMRAIGDFTPFVCRRRSSDRPSAAGSAASASSASRAAAKPRARPRAADGIAGTLHTAHTAHTARITAHHRTHRYHTPLCACVDGERGACAYRYTMCEMCYKRYKHNKYCPVCALVYQDRDARNPALLRSCVSCRHCVRSWLFPSCRVSCRVVTQCLLRVSCVPCCVSCGRAGACGV